MAVLTTARRRRARRRHAPATDATFTMVARPLLHPWAALLTLGAAACSVGSALHVTVTPWCDNSFRVRVKADSLDTQQARQCK